MGGPDAAHAHAGWMVPTESEVVSAVTTRHHADRGDSADLGKLVTEPLSLRNGGRDSDQRDNRSGIGLTEGTAHTLQAEQQHAVVVPDDPARPVGRRGRDGGTMPELGDEPLANSLGTAGGGSGMPTVLAYAPEQAATLTAGVSASEGVNPPGRRQEDDVNLIAVESVTGEHTHALTSEGADASEDGTGQGTPIIAVPPWRRGKRAVEPQLDPDHGAVPIEVRNALRGGGATGVGTPGTGVGEDGDPAPTLGTAVTPAVATFRKQRRAADPTDDETWVEGDVANTLNTFDGGDTRATEVVIEPETFTLEPETGQGADLRARETDVSPAVTVTDHARTTDRGVRVTDPADATVRRLTPTECERLQGFPDLWLFDGLELSDSAMYRMLGNAVCVAVSAWTGWRLAAYLRGWRP